MIEEPEQGRYVLLSWVNVMVILAEKFGAKRTDAWNINGFVPPDDEYKHIIRLDIPEDARDGD